MRSFLIILLLSFLSPIVSHAECGTSFDTATEIIYRVLHEKVFDGSRANSMQYASGVYTLYFQKYHDRLAVTFLRDGQNVLGPSEVSVCDSSRPGELTARLLSGQFSDMKIPFQKTSIGFSATSYDPRLGMGEGRYEFGHVKGGNSGDDSSGNNDTGAVD